ncbi:peptide chain release factor N(5)-glutamine methyltransferase [Pacificimonas sp. WHA3]|uniref:Release factor glutamine methyltransferase n=1 Tax=Pacificimonas pallii TaxID=2827236 RepID=A0ABS6SH53_9SPHN|nr:peptide chain release factor N(5)-glutamine methyltransferase [Pacificimonas pallii]MBV7257742.1 peptide chain release factor N(5)-glutamine methyltransferase [Pacificimonas pallii]
MLTQVRYEGGHHGTSLFALISTAARELSASAQPETARLDAELLAAHVIGADRSALLLGARRHQIDADAYRALIARRAAGEPLAYITGQAEFWSLALKVTPDTLIPRADSESLIEAALAHFGDRPPHRILDLGTGSGCLLLAALSEFPDAGGTGIDASPAALAVAMENAATLGMSDRAMFRRGDWCAELTEAFDLILCNPPYVDAADILGPGVREHEPHPALFAAADGLADYLIIVPQLAARLTQRGVAILEIGAGQGAAVRDMAAKNGLRFADGRKDLAGHERALSFTRS